MSNVRTNELCIFKGLAKLTSVDNPYIFWTAFETLESRFCIKSSHIVVSCVTDKAYAKAKNHTNRELSSHR